MINPQTQNAILQQFDRQVGLYSDLASTAASLIEKILSPALVQVHSVTHRCKNRDSLVLKLAKEDKQYKDISDITDLAALRITTYFAEDVDLIAEIIEKEFLIDEDNSVDKRNRLDPDRFGYQSLHYIASIKSDRCQFIEYARFKSLSFEIQVRSILQHAWAEIEHDLGYKSAAGVPREIRRRFSRIAGLLELADDEFAAIRKELAAYKIKVSAEIQSKPESVEIDNVSLSALAESETSAVRKLSESIARLCGATLKPTPEDKIDKTVESLRYINITTIASLEKIIHDKLPSILKFAEIWLEDSKYDEIGNMIGLFYLAYFEIVSKKDAGQLVEYFKQFNIGTDLPSRKRSAARMIKVYKQVVPDT